MNKKIKRLLSALLAAMVLCGALPIAAAAVTSGEWEIHFPLMHEWI